MRTLIVASLLASIALPAAAQADAGPWGRNRQDQSSASSSSSSDQGATRRSWSRPADAEPARAAPAPRQRDNDNRASGMVAPQNDAPRGWGRRERPDTAPTAPAVEQQAVRAASSDAPRGWGRRDGGQTAPVTVPGREPAVDQAVRTWGRGDRAVDARRGVTRGNPQVRIGQYNEAVRQRAVRPANSSPVMSRIVQNIRTNPNWREHRWNDDWRNDRQYDWRRYRDYNRNLFYLGSYYDPWGYGYNRFQVGWSLWPSYYGQNYWINDPWMYRLPPAYGPYRWIRYWDDALLVNTYTGEVVDVVYDFFW